jgi:glycosyltransferase involved in cell wall biosynthesis
MKEPRGGTELQFEYLKNHVDPKLLDKVQICTSIPDKVPLHPEKKNILWQKNSYDQPNLHPWFKDKSNHNKYDWYVFNSHWNFEKFRMMFDLPGEKCLVIKNGLDHIKVRDLENKKDKIRLIFQPTPWRGLSVLLAAMQMINNRNIILDVYSSTEVYGENFKKDNDSEFKALYDQAEQLPNVNYIGYKPNEYIKENLHKYDIFAYPSIWEETFCISLLESMRAGLHCITTNYGALFETGAEKCSYIPYQKNYLNLAKTFARSIEACADYLYTEQSIQHLKHQVNYTHLNYNWNKIGNQWSSFLEGITNE